MLIWHVGAVDDATSTGICALMALTGPMVYNCGFARYLLDVFGCDRCVVEW